MKTDDLIRALAADEQIERPQLLLRVAMGAALSLAMLGLFWHVRPDLGVALENPLVLAKFVLPGVLALFCLASARGASGWWFALPVVAVAALFIATLPQQGIARAIMGDSAWTCLTSIPFLALPVGAGVFLALRRHVIAKPARAGLVAGVFAGALAAFIYALHCDEDAPSFYVVWYSAGIVISGLAGRWLGRRRLGI